MVMNAQTRQVGAVANLKSIKAASKVARQVLEQTYHTLLVGEDATSFAQRIGFTTENLTTPYSIDLWKQWLAKGKQPNFWKKQPPPPPAQETAAIAASPQFIEESTSTNNKNKMPPYGHDTIGMIVMNDKTETSCGTSTNGLSFRIPGRVGDCK